MHQDFSPFPPHPQQLTTWEFHFHLMSWYIRSTPLSLQITITVYMLVSTLVKVQNDWYVLGTPNDLWFTSRVLNEMLWIMTVISNYIHSTSEMFQTWTAEKRNMEGCEMYSWLIQLSRSLIDWHSIQLCHIGILWRSMS